MKTEVCMETQFSGEIEQITKSEMKMIPGVWVNGKTYWMKRGMDALVLDEGITLQLTEENIHHNTRIFVVKVTNHFRRSIKVKLLLQHRCCQWDYNHLSFISPLEDVVFHLANDSVHLVNGVGNCRNAKKICTVLPLWNIYKDQIWKSSQSGTVQYCPLANGNAVSLLLYDLNFVDKGSFEGKSWIISGENEVELVKINESLLKTD
ncbi:hypothetical protein J2Z40_002194 [Cytobacillus eiseniae]|uniref:Ricin B lectin domain-containing protein n=1 Tax=Cytobacillus eiseniae TaxID=762947 RepID=A0ABS4RIH2_9BACI|nr:hypothetical protein [Cytobacillus eiseniae]MBP2241622.1 hypothetical protein [Cytobacillus eiseniae]